MGFEADKSKLSDKIKPEHDNGWPTQRIVNKLKLNVLGIDVEKIEADKKLAEKK